MTYQVLARKWRPRNFREMAGQGHVLKTLINSLDNNRLHHAYLFTGTRGVGKTTIARILARCLNCEEGITSAPCGQCSACKEIDEGRFIDLIEVDAASRTKVEDTRELLDNVQYSPTRGRFKVYLIDEVHMLSGHSFNALLKTLEEPPPHVKFLLATTDPQKLPVTVLSRCLQFNLKNISPERLVEHIKHILGEEKIPFEEPALWQLGRAAQGSVRDCLTLLDQAIGYCEGNITDSDVRAFLGTIDQGVIHELVNALVHEDAARVMEIIENAADHAPDFSAVLADLQSYLHRVAIAQAVPEGIDNAQGDRKQVLEHAAAIPAETLQLYYQVALKGRADMPYAIDARSGLEMALLRMLAFTPHGVPTVPESTLDGRNSEKKKPVIHRTESQSSPPLLNQQNPASPDIHGTVSVKNTHVDTAEQGMVNAMPDSGQTTGPVPENEVGSSGNTLPVDEISRPEPEHPGNSNEEQVVQLKEETLDKSPISLESLEPEKWISLFYQLSLEGITRSIAANCLLESVSGNHIVLVLDKSQMSVFNDEQERRISKAFDAYFEQTIQLDIRPGEVNVETPSAWRQRMERERLEAAVRTFENDYTVQEIVKRFSGAVQRDSIVPTSPKHY